MILRERSPQEQGVASTKGLGWNHTGAGIQAGMGEQGVSGGD